MTQTTTAAPAPTAPRGVVRDAWRLLVNNYFALAGVALATFVASVAVFLLNVIPVLGQVFSAFLMSLVIGLGFLVSLEIARRTPTPVQAVVGRLSLNRVVELSIVLLPIGIMSLVASALVGLSFLVSVGGASLIGGRPNIGMTVVSTVFMAVLALLAAFLRAWIVVKVIPAATYVLAAPKDAAIAPLTRLKQGWGLSNGRAGGFAVHYWLVVFVGMLIDLVPLIGVTVGRVLFTDPFIFAGMVVIYHRLIARPLAGLQPKMRTTADIAAEQAGPY